jgi:hypothetical protein
MSETDTDLALKRLVEIMATLRSPAGCPGMPGRRRKA